jgi:histidinol-phosphate/aromatic aminotransferase/cobyric acid decarboxylase-like protein/adenosyl cobinamide kinase/adenosyl cobinamide phosphate guanylyltransferase
MDFALHEHGDRHVPPGALDLAVNVHGPTPAWLVEELRSVDLVGYPDPAAATAAVAERHGARTEEVLVLAGAAEAFWLIAHALRPRVAACIHPSFTGAEAALRAAGVPVRRVVRDPAQDWRLDPADVPDDADLVVLGRPDNPTGRVEPIETIAALARPGRVLLVDEAFADFQEEASGLYGSGIPGLVCLRSLTKLWGLAGLRVGYLLGPPSLVADLAVARQPWPVGSPALRATELLVRAERERRARAAAVAVDRERLLQGLAGFPLTVWPSPANFLLLRSDRTDLRPRLLERGIAVRPAETFPGLDAHYVRVAVHPEASVRTPFVSALGELLSYGENADVRPHEAVVAPPEATSRAHRTLILGGARSGKSRHAQRLMSTYADVVYVAPGPVPDGTDSDWAARVAEHQRNRPAGWVTLETADVAGALESATQPVLVDCLATWLAAAMEAAGAWESADGDIAWQEKLEVEVERLLRAWRSVRVPVVAVSNEVGSGVIPGTRSGVLFRDALGGLNRRVADLSDDVRLVVAGRVQRLDGERA